MHCHLERVNTTLFSHIAGERHEKNDPVAATPPPDRGGHDNQCSKRSLGLHRAARGLGFLSLFFGLRFMRSKKMMPAGVMTILSIVDLALYGTLS